MSKRRRHKRNAENPNVPLSIAFYNDEAADALGAKKSASGVRVTPKRALGYAAVWRALSLISGNIAKLPLCVYKKKGRNRDIDEKHPAYNLLMWKPNESMTAFTFKQTLQAHALDGNGYAHIDRDKSGNPLGLYILDPRCVEPVRKNGQLWYVYEPMNGGELNKIPSADVLHIRGLGFDGLVGYNVLEIHNDSIGTALAARDYSARYFRNNARPGGVITHPGKLSDKARTNMRESWDRIHSGLSNAHRVAILEEGATYTPFDVNARNAQLLENREYDAREIANIYGVPTHKLGDPSKVAYNSLDAENQSYFDDTLSNWMMLWTQETRDKLLSEKEKARETHLIDFDHQAILRFLAAQTNFVSTMVGGKILNRNEGRAVFGYDPIDGGDDFDEQQTTTPKEEKTAPKTDGLRAVVADTASRMVRRLVNNSAKYRAGEDYGAFVARVGASQERFIADALAPTILACSDLGYDLSVDEAGKLLIRETVEGLTQAGHERADSSADALANHVAEVLNKRIFEGN